jgi:hypothetical protein
MKNKKTIETMKKNKIKTNMNKKLLKRNNQYQKLDYLNDQNEK